MKHILMLSVISGALALSGCSTFNNMLGKDDSGMHEVQATTKNTAPVASKNGMLVDATNHMTLYTFALHTTKKQKSLLKQSHNSNF